MLSGITARERGDPVDDLDDVLHLRWSQLNLNAARSINSPLKLGHCVSTVDVDALGSTELIVCGGASSSPALEGVLSLYQYHWLHTVSAKNANANPLVTLPIKGVVSAVRWIPFDSSLFLCAETAHRNQPPMVSAWDTEEFQPICSMPIASSSPSSAPSTVSAIASPSHSKSKPELIAVAAPPLRHVTLIDLGSGSTTHVLQPERDNAPIADVAWSPTHPHLLAAAAVDGIVSLFDVRRAGTVACLLTIDNRNPLLDQQLLYPVTQPEQAATPTRSPQSVRPLPNSTSPSSLPRARRRSQTGTLDVDHSVNKPSRSRSLMKRLSKRLSSSSSTSSSPSSTKRQQLQSNGKQLVESKEPPLSYTLGLGCTWRDSRRRKPITVSPANTIPKYEYVIVPPSDATDARQSFLVDTSRRRRRRTNHMVNHHTTSPAMARTPAINRAAALDPISARVRFTPDGSTIVSSRGAAHQGIKTNDILTGRTVTDLPNLCTNARTFGVAPDGLHLMAFHNSALFHTDIVTGAIVNVSTTPHGNIVKDFALHQADMCAVTVTGQTLEFWDCAVILTSEHDE